MSREAEVLDSLSREIAEFRETVVLWIDTALVRLREREQEESLAMEKTPAPAALTRLRADRGPQTRSPETGTKSTSPPSDSLKRLDALARLLDQRVKVSQEAVSDSAGAGGEVDQSSG